jgi:hypothetical protein
MNRNQKISSSLWIIGLSLILIIVLGIPSVTAQITENIPEVNTSKDNAEFVKWGIGVLINISLSIIFFLYGRYFEKVSSQKIIPMARLNGILEDVKILDILKVHKVLTSTLIVILGYFLGYFIFWISGQNPNDVEYIGWGGFWAIVFTFVPTAWALIKIIRL